MKRRFNWAIPGLLAMLLIIAGVALAQSLAAVAPDPAKLATQCSACHAMEEQVVTWQASSHQQVACTDCHADPGVRGWVEMQLGRLRMLTSARRDPHGSLSQVATTVTNERCLDCHAREMPWVMQDLEPEGLRHFPALAGHDLHLTLEQPLSCTDCHSGVAHGPAQKAERVEEWHNTCLQCHAEQQVTMGVRTSISCSACHTDLPLVSPDSHKQPDFRTTHGQAAGQEIQSCQQCHLTPGLVSMEAGQQPPAAHFQPVNIPHSAAGIPAMPPGSLRVTEGMKDACASCHGLTMPHPQDWLSNHVNGFAERPELCASCHGTRDQGFSVKVMGNPRALSTTDATCTTCHAQPMPHPENWSVEAHQAQAQIVPQSCAQCHSPANPANPGAAHAAAQFCADCHMARFVHPAGYLAAHGKAARTAGGEISASCTTCHLVDKANTGLTALAGASARACTDCHTAGFGTGVKQAWHPDAWIRDHQSVALNPNGEVAADCAACHTPTFNSCADCHTTGFGAGVKQEWHPPMFWVTHGRTTRPEDLVSCQSCHSYVEPSCAKCHRGY